MKDGKIITINRTNIGEGKHVIGVLRQNYKWKTVCKDKTPHIPALMEDKKIRKMHNFLGYHLTKRNGVYVLFDWYDIEFWDKDKIIISGGYIHTGDKNEGFREIMPDEYCILNTTLARKTLRTVGGEGGESNLSEDLFGEDSGMTGEDSGMTVGEDSGMTGEDSSGFLKGNYTVKKSLKRFLILDSLGFRCEENGNYSAHKIYYNLFKFFNSKNLLLLSSISAMQIADDKWYTYNVLTSIPMWKRQKHRKLPYYIPYTLLGSYVLEKPRSLDGIRKRVLEKFGDNEQWQENPMVFVVKPRRGSLGAGIRFHKTNRECLEDLKNRRGEPKEYIVQEYVLLKNKKGLSHDYRVLVSGNEMVWAYERIATDEKTLTANRSTGGSGKELSRKTMKELEPISERMIKHLKSANLRFSNLYNMVSDYKKKHPEYKVDKDVRKKVEELWDKFGVLYRSAWEFFGYDVAPSEWGGEKQYVLIEINTSPGVQGPDDFGKLDDLMSNVAGSLLKYCKGYGPSSISSPFYNVKNFPSEGLNEGKPKKEKQSIDTSLPTIVILTDWIRGQVDEAFDRIERWDVIGYLQTASKINYANVIAAPVSSLFVQDGTLFVRKGIIKDPNKPEKFVEKTIMLPVDYLMRKNYESSKSKLNKRSVAYKSLIEAGVKDADTEWGFGNNITRWFEQKGGPTLITRPVSKVASSKVATEFAFINYKKTGVNVRRPKTFLCDSVDKIIKNVIKLKNLNFKGAVIKPSRGYSGHGILFLNLLKEEDELKSEIKKKLPRQIKGELRKSKIIVQGIVENLHLIRNMKTNLRSVVTPIVENGQIKSVHHVFSWDRLSKAKYDGDPDNMDAQKPLGIDKDEEDEEKWVGDYPYLRDYIEKRYVDKGIIKKIEYETLHALRAIFERGKKWGNEFAFDIAPFDVILAKEGRRVVPVIIEVNSQGGIFRGFEKLRDKDAYIRERLAEVSFPVIAKRAIEFKEKREAA